MSSRPASAAPIDPIFAAIERHKKAYQLSMLAARIRSDTIDASWHPEYDPVKRAAVMDAESSADDEADDAADALTSIRPTTMAGVLALIHYVEAFNAGAFFLEPDSTETVSDWQSGPIFWPRYEDDQDDVSMFGFAILANVRSALEAMAVQS